ncbi:MAG: hypothetical protein M3H12_01170, partial [Chromatiales bacterium]
NKVETVWQSGNVYHWRRNEINIGWLSRKEEASAPRGDVQHMLVSRLSQPFRAVGQDFRR